MNRIPKALKRKLQELSRQAYEEELRRMLLPLSEAFEAWKASKLDSFDLAGLIHTFHNGPDRELHTRYNTSSVLEFNVAGAIRNGILARDKIPGDVMEYLSRYLEFYEREE